MYHLARLHNNPGHLSLSDKAMCVQAQLRHLIFSPVKPPKRGPAGVLVLTPQYRCKLAQDEQNHSSCRHRVADMSSRSLEQLRRILRKGFAGHRRTVAVERLCSLHFHCMLLFIQVEDRYVTNLLLLYPW